MTSFDTVKKTYRTMLKKELAYRSSDKSFNDVVEDTINACFSIISKGQQFKNDYQEFLSGIRAVGNHVISQNYNPDSALKHACKILFPITSIKADLPECKVERQKQLIDLPDYARLNFVKKIDPESFDYLLQAIRQL